MSTDLQQANRQIVFAKRPQGEPTLDCFRLATTPIPALGEGQVLVRNDFVSVDPYIRMRMEERDSYAPVMKLGEVMVGRTVGQVIASRDPAWGTGQWVVGRLGWQDFSLTTGAELEKIDPTAAPLTAYLGALGSTGITAWVGLVHFGRPKPGDTVVVSAAAGAVGSVVGQLARRYGCHAIGIAGGPAKCRLVVDELGFDACVDYKSPSFAADLKAAVPKGIDVYYENVGGVVLDTVLPLLNNYARIPFCGLVSQYNATEPYGIKNIRELFNHRATMQAFVLTDHRDLFPQARAELKAAYAAGQLQHRETIAEGLENAPQAFIDMLRGASVGKQIVRVRAA